MFDADRLFRGDTRNFSREQLVEAWFDSGPATRERMAVVRASRRGFRAHRGAALTPLYRESLALHDRLSAHVCARVEGSVSGPVLSRVPPSFAERRYVLVDAANGRALDEGLEAMRRDPSVWLLTQDAFRLYLLHRNPWEYATLSATSGEVALAPPAVEVFEQAIRFSLYREIPRHYGVRGETGHIGPLYSQARLYVDERHVASDRRELGNAYRQRYGAELVTDGSEDEYFRRQYPEVCGVIEGLRGSLERRRGHRDGDSIG
jgi:hypothetical protein